MEVLTSEYEIAKIEDSKLIPRDGVLLWVWHVDKIPPHIGISTRGSYYSLKANGKDEGLVLSLIESIIEKKKIKTLVFALDREFSIEEVDTIFSQFTETVPLKITCLNPIKSLLSFNEAGKLSELLSALDGNDLILDVYGYNIGNQFGGLEKYTEKDIHSRLIKLSNE